MVSARFRIVWLPDPTTSDSLTTAQLADTISQIVDVNGDTMTKFSIPYLNPKTWLMVANYEDVNGTSWVPESTWKYANGQIRVILETPVAASQTVASSKIYFSIFVAGGPYFEVNRPQTIKTNYVFPVDTQAESLSLWDECAKQPEPILPCDHSMSFNVTSGDSVGSFSDYFHRYTLFSYAQANPGILYYDLDYLPSPGNLEATAWKRVFTTFHAHRGSIRYKIVPVAMKADYGGRSVPMGVVNNYLARDLSTYGPRSYDSINGVHFFDLSENSAEFQVPYNNDEPYVMLKPFANENLNRPTAAYGFVNTDLSQNSALIYVATGDDFSFLYPMSPLVLEVPVIKNDDLPVIQKEEEVATDLKPAFLKENFLNSSEMPTVS